MKCKKSISLLLTIIVAFLPTVGLAQVPPDVKLARIFEILDLQEVRLGIVVVAGSSNRGYESGYEYWRFSERALLEIAEEEGLELALWAEGEWDDPWVVEALGWQPDDASVEWSHPAEVEWTPQAESLPPVIAGGAYFGNATIGGLTIQYSERGPASLTWFKTTEGAYMQLEDGAVFERDEESPVTGSWWRGPIESVR